MMDDAKIKRRLDRLCSEYGMALKKGPLGYQITDRTSGKVVFGARHDLTLKDVAIKLQGVGILGRGGR